MVELRQKKKKAVFFLLIICSFLLTGFGKKEMSPANGGGEKPAETTSGIVAPENLESCSERFYEKNEKGGRELRQKIRVYKV